jgi:hypothetical protein
MFMSKATLKEFQSLSIVPFYMLLYYVMYNYDSKLKEKDPY